jgi:polyphosphate kinase 2 (PPK2 family)
MGKISLKDISTRAPKDFEKDATKKKTNEILDKLDDLQNLLFAEGKHSVLIILQGLDASGKDGVIRNVFGKLNPQGVTVRSYKAPTAEELSHDFLWRIHHAAPAKGMLQIFNRSHYEDILINNTHILKFYMHISPEEQHERLMERMKDPGKMWKYNENDFEEAKHLDKYMKMYEDCFEQCDKIPWTIVPADQNWYKEYVIASAVHNLLKDLDMKYPGLKK